LTDPKKRLTQKLWHTIGFLIVVPLLSLSIIFLGFNGNAGSARYILSAIGQSLTAVVVLSFTIPLIILQPVASKYGTKVYELYLDKYTYGFMGFAVFSTVFSFFGLTMLYERDNEFLTPLQDIYVTVALLLLVLVLLFLIAFIGHLTEKLKPEYIISSYVQEIKNLISKDDRPRAYEKVDALKSIGIAAVREREDMVFGEFLTVWLDLLTLKNAAPIRTVLENSLPNIFKIAAREDEIIAKIGLDKLQLIVSNSVEKNEIEKAKRVVELFPSIMGPLVNTYPEIVRYSFDRLRDIGQMSISRPKSEEAFEIPTKAIHALRDIGKMAVFTKPELVEEALDVEEALHEIAYIINAHRSRKNIIEEGIKAIAEFNLDYWVGGDALPIRNPQKVKTKANNELIGILYSISTEPSTKDVKDKIEIAELIVPHIGRVYTCEQTFKLIIIASRFLKEDEDSTKELLNKIAKNIKEADTENIADGIELAKKRAGGFNWDLPIEEFQRRYLKLE